MPDVLELFEEMQGVNREISRYAYKLTIENAPAYSVTGIFNRDRRAKSAHIVTGNLEEPAIVNYTWIDNEAVGSPSQTDHEFDLIVHGPPSCLLSAALSLCTQEDPMVVEATQYEGQECWKIAVTPSPEWLNANPLEAIDRTFSVEYALAAKGDKFINVLARALGHAHSRVTYTVAQQSMTLASVHFEVFYLDSIASIRVAFSDFDAENIDIVFPERPEAGDRRKVPLGLLFFKPSRFGWSEDTHCHMTAEAIKLLKRFDRDQRYEELYEHHSAPDYYSKLVSGDPAGHPCVIGTWAEDAWETPRATNRYRYWLDTAVRVYRSFRHFGFEDGGLRWEKYMYLVASDQGGNKAPDGDEPCCPGYPENPDERCHAQNECRPCKLVPPVGDRFISAFHWGKEDGAEHAAHDVKCDKMNLKGAIEVYGEGTTYAREESYYRMGHVLHLLQDMAQPDHAMNKDHAASSMTEAQALEKFQLCLAGLAENVEQGIFVAGAAGIAAGGPAGAIVAGIYVIATCISYADCRDYDNEVGFEYLVKDKWDEDFENGPWNATNCVDLFTQQLSSEDSSYDSLFRAMGNDAVRAAQSRGLKLPLGLESQTVTSVTNLYVGATEGRFVAPPPYVPGVDVPGVDIQSVEIPGVDPDIDADDPDSYLPYIELAREVIGKAIFRSAALFKYFYEVVNAPPIVQRIAVAKGGEHITPVGFATFSGFSDSSDCAFVTVRYAAHWKDVGNQREKVVERDYPLSASHHIYVFVTFGPQLSGNRRMQEDSVWLRASSTDQQFDDIEVSMQRSQDIKGEEYYWCAFPAPALSQEDYDMQLAIFGEDDAPHLLTRTQAVRELDSNPATVAYADAAQAPEYHIRNYEPGADTSHQIRVSGVLETDQLERNNTFESATEISLTHQQRTISYEGLTILEPDDVDCFHIHYESDEKDDRVTASFKTSAIAGLHWETWAPQLTLYIHEEFRGCLAVQIANPDKSIYRDFERVGPLGQVIIEAPTAAFGDAKELYIALKNLNFQAQGPLHYQFSVRYEETVTKLEGEILYEFWRYTELNPPVPGDSLFPPFKVLGDPPRSLVYRAPALLLSHLQGFVSSSLFDSGLTTREQAIEKAHFIYRIGQLASNLHVDNVAIDLLSQSAGLFESEGLETKSRNAKQLLRETLIRSRRIDEVSRLRIMPIRR